MGVNIQTIKDIRIFLSKELNHLYPAEEISSIAGIIIRTVTGLSRLHEINNPEFLISPIQAEEIIKYCEELVTGKPVQYVTGETEFYNCRIKLNRSTLIPRPETEEIVDLIIKENRNFRGKIIDIGTGSGCIAIPLALNIKGAVVTGTDISEEAIRISKENAMLNNAVVTFEKADMLRSSDYIKYSVGLIVSNPPYVRNSEKNKMMSNVIDFEPHQALFVPDSDPLVFYRAISEIAGKILIPGGLVYLEINEAMGPEMLNLFLTAGFSDVKIIKDINGKDRILKGSFNGR
jgi:release factor glutamine methyltransferase